MPNYLVDKVPDDKGERLVHEEECKWISNNRISIGYFTSCQEAINKAKEYYPRINGCVRCMGDCHRK